MLTPSRPVCPFHLPGYWYALAGHARQLAWESGDFLRDANGWPVYDPVQAVYTFLDVSPKAYEQPEQRTLFQMALDLSTDARLALAVAWDLVTEREPIR